MSNKEKISIEEMAKISDLITERSPSDDDIIEIVSIINDESIEDEKKIAKGIAELDDNANWL